MEITTSTTCDLPDIEKVIVSLCIAFDNEIEVYAVDDSDNPNERQYYLRRDIGDDIINWVEDLDLDNEGFAEPQNKAIRDVREATLAGDGMAGYGTGWNVAFLSDSADQALQMLKAYADHQQKLYPNAKIRIDRGHERL